MSLGALVVLAGTATLGAFGCTRFRSTRPGGTDAEQSPPAPIISGPPSVHHTGLTLDAQPPRIRVRETAVGFRVEPAEARRMRNPWSVELRLSGDDPLAGAAIETRKVGDREAHFRVTVDEEAGSGGPLHTLVASMSCGSRHIVLTARQQAEHPGRPDWSAAWAILGAARCQVRDY